MRRVAYCLNGPNLNLLGSREPEIYGQENIADIEEMVRSRVASLGGVLVFRQTNKEGLLVDWIQEARGGADALIINAAAFTHSSIAIHDALKALSIPIVEVHLSNPAAREAFRSVNYVSPVARCVIAGLGAWGYDVGAQAAMRLIGSGSGQLIEGSEGGKGGRGGKGGDP